MSERTLYSFRLFFLDKQMLPIHISPCFGDLTFFPLFTYFLNRLLLSLTTPPLHYYIQTAPPSISLPNSLMPAPTNGRLPTSADTHGQHLSHERPYASTNKWTPTPPSHPYTNLHVFSKIVLIYQCYLPTPFPSLLTSFTTRTHLPLFFYFFNRNIAIPRAEIRQSQLPLAPDF